MIYLYIKIHNVTGLKYLGKTVKDPFTYRGSGNTWKKHLRQYENDVKTIVLFETECPKEFRKAGIYYSDLFDVVNSSAFANETREEGQGGYTSYGKERNRKISKALKGRKATWAKKGTNRGKVVAVDSKTGERVSVTREEFKSDVNLRGIASLNTGTKKSEKWKNSIKKKYAKSPRQGTIVEYENIRYPSRNALGRAKGLGKGKVHGMIKRGEIKIISEFHENKDK